MQHAYLLFTKKLIQPLYIGDLNGGSNCVSNAFHLYFCETLLSKTLKGFTKFQVKFKEFST